MNNVCQLWNGEKQVQHWRNHPAFQHDLCMCVSTKPVYVTAHSSKCLCLCLYSCAYYMCIRMCTTVQSWSLVCKQMYSHTDALLITQLPSLLCLSSGPIPPFFPSHPPLPPMCPRCPNPFPGRKALIEGAGFGLWPVGTHYCVFISKWGLPDWFNIHVSASYSWPSTQRLHHCQISLA